MSCFLGIDTSNYTTSAALAEEGEITKNIRKILTVGQGERGLRQSDAVFAHTVNLPEVLAQIGAASPRAIGVSLTPRDAEGSYMPCFLAGKAAASGIATLLGVPLYGFSHQRGHLMAALYSCARTDLYEREFLAFHVSGGTTEVVHVREGQITLLGGSEDISCGKAIDRVGVMLGLRFPCGAELEALAASGRLSVPVKTCVRGMTCNLSGLENNAARLIEGGSRPEDTAAYVIAFVGETLVRLSKQARTDYPGIPIVYAGGVMSNRLIRPALASLGESYFAEPAFSCDNAAGIALLCEREWRNG